MGTKLKYELLLVFTASLWGLAFPLMKLVNGAVDSVPFLAVRFLIATAILFFFNWRKLAQITWRMVLSCGGFGVLLTLHSFLQVQGLRYTTASNSGFITATNVIFVPFFMFLLFRKKPGRNIVLGLISILAGFLLISGVVKLNPFQLAFSAFNLGDILTLACAVFTAIYMIVCNRLVARYDESLVNFIHFVFATLAAFVCWPLSPEKNADFSSWPVWVSVLYCGIFGSALAFVFLMKAQTKIDATRTAIFCSLEPVFALVFALFVPDMQGNVETLGLPSVLGGGLILFGVIFSSTEQAKRNKTCRQNPAASMPR